MQIAGTDRVVVSPRSVSFMDDPIVKKMLTTQDRNVTELIRNRAKMLEEKKAALKRKVNPHRPFYEVMADGAWSGEQCFIVGGGPSLTGFDFERLRGKGRVIAINRAYESAPFADICFFMDGSQGSFYGLVNRGRLGAEALEAWRRFEGHKVYLNLVGRRLDDVYSVRSSGRVGLSNSIKNGLFHGNNSGVGAIGLAICLRANPIYLLGFDCKYEGNKSHYHSGYPGRRPESVFSGFARDFSKLNRFIVRTGYRVINLNPQSGLRCFRFSTIEGVLDGAI